MSNRVKIVTVLSFLVLAAGGGLAFAQMEGPPPPDGPMQGLMRGHGREADRFLGTFDLNHDAKVTRLRNTMSAISTNTGELVVVA